MIEDVGNLMVFIKWTGNIWIRCICLTHGMMQQSKNGMPLIVLKGIFSKGVVCGVV
jgi:hypothetical protein